MKKTYEQCFIEALEDMHIGDNPRISDADYTAILASPSPSMTAGLVTKWRWLSFNKKGWK